ncbi:MAG TPA: DUF1778 domain-containing protein [Xanthobacteraceae bacterium]|nr:DUF1778 domain-containing protein [Xanthobacteraceae bacterium]
MATLAKRDTLNIRIKPAERSLIDQAAQSLGKNRTDFILDAARRAAEEALLDRAVVSVTPEAYAAFLARLDAPAQPNERLRRTMQTPAPWELP